LLTEAEIQKQLDKKCTIVMTVRNTGASSTSKLIFLNSAPNRFHDENFTVVLQPEAQKMLRDAGINDPRAHFKEEIIQVSGTLSLFQGRPQILVKDATQVKILKK
jgi:DNA/RNA endonuclease YhcR with UshA esterase domain